MKISAVNNYSNYTKAQSFNGLWGKTSRWTDVDNVLCVPIIKDVKYYYPFVDEDSAKVSNIIESEKCADFVKEDGLSKYKIHDCKLGIRLPFNEQQYEAYMNLPETFKLDKTIEEMHYRVRDKYKTSDFGNKQIPAYNQNVENRIMNTFV